MVAKLEVTLKTVGCPKVKFVRKRLRVKTPTLKHGQYIGCSVQDVMRHDERYWRSHVAYNVIQFVGSYSRFVAVEKEFEACEQKRLEQNRFRYFVEANAFVNERRNAHRPVQRPLDYIYTGDEIIRGSSNLSGQVFRDRLAWRHARANKQMVTMYKSGRTHDPHQCDLARYILQEYQAARYHY